MEETPEESLLPRASIGEDPLRAITLNRSSRRSHVGDTSYPCQKPEAPEGLHKESFELRNLVSDLQNHSTGISSVRKYHLSPHDFRRLDDYLAEEDWKRARYDYFVDTETFTLRMAPPSHKHEFVHMQLILLLLQRLQQLWSPHQVSCPFSVGGSAAVKNDRGSVFIPDNQIICKDMKWPILLLEVGNSQSIKSLNKKSFRYIQAGSGKIRYVVTLKLHRDSQAVDLTLSTPKFTSNGPLTVLEAESTSQTLRNTNGEPGDGAGLVISVDHMTPPELLPKSICGRTIVISVDELCDIIRTAEESEEATNPGYFSDIPPSFVRSPSPASTSSIESDHQEQAHLSISGKEQDKSAIANDTEFKPGRRFSGRSYRSPIKRRSKANSLSHDDTTPIQG